MADLPPELRETAERLILNTVAAAAGAGGRRERSRRAAVANMYNRQLHEEEGELIRKKASIYAERQGISIADAQAILTGQAQRQADSEAAKRFAENSSARAFLAEISLGLQGSGFAYFDGKADGSYDNQVLFAGGVKDSATLTTLYDAAWKRAQAGATKPTILTGSDLALADASRDIANYLRNPEEIAKVAQALRVERDKAEAAQDFTRVRVLDDKLTNISLMQNGGLFDLSEGLTWEQREILGMALQAGWMAEAVGFPSPRHGGQGAGGSVGREGARVYWFIACGCCQRRQPALEVRNAEVLGRDGEVLVKQNPATGEYEAVGGKRLLGEDTKGTETSPKTTIRDRYEHHKNAVDDIKDELIKQGYRVSERKYHLVMLAVMECVGRILLPGRQMVVLKLLK